MIVWHMDDVGWGWWIVMSVGMVAFWGLLIYGIVSLARGGPRSSEPAASEAPITLLQRRMAAGEISVEEYERLRAALEDRSGG